MLPARVRVSETGSPCYWTARPGQRVRVILLLDSESWSASPGQRDRIILLLDSESGSASPGQRVRASDPGQRVRGQRSGPERPDHPTIGQRDLMINKSIKNKNIKNTLL